MLLLLEDWKSPYLKGAVGYNFGEDAIRAHFHKCQQVCLFLSLRQENPLKFFK